MHGKNARLAALWRAGIFVALLLVGVLATSRAWVASLPASGVADRLADTLAGHGSMAVEDAFAPDAQVFLVGATMPVSPNEFAAYLDRLSGQHRAFLPNSAILRTSSGAAWLVSIGEPDTAVSQDSAQIADSGLWVQATINNDRITRLWFVFRSEDIGARYGGQAAYAADAGSRGTPVPPGWADGTPAALVALQQADRQQHQPQRHVLPGLMLVASWIPLVVFVSRGLLGGRQASPRAPGAGRLLTSLQQFQAQRGGWGGSAS